MTSSALAVAGWATALPALVSSAIARRALTSRRRAVAEASHELRAPLAAITLGIELGARQGRLSPARIRAIELELGRAALALEDLETARGRREAKSGVATVNLRELLGDSVEAWRPSAAARGIDVRLRWSGPEGFVLGDRLRLAQATGNLIANAIEHGGGEVEVRGRCSHGYARVEVLDAGPGLSAPVLELIRRPASAPALLRGLRPHSVGRRGHGLRIACAIAAAHGGRLAAAPAERGARLLLELPADVRGGSAQAEHR